MRFTCIFCFANLILLGAAGAVFAFTGVDVLKYVFFNAVLPYRVYLAICGVCAIFAVYALIVFKPFKGLK